MFGGGDVDKMDVDNTQNGITSSMKRKPVNEETISMKRKCIEGTKSSLERGKQQYIAATVHRELIFQPSPSLAEKIWCATHTSPASVLPSGFHVCDQGTTNTTETIDHINAVKSDDAGVPVHLWTNAILGQVNCRSINQDYAFNYLRMHMLGWWKRNIIKSLVTYLNKVRKSV